MPKLFKGKLIKFEKLDENQKEFLIEHYRRTEQFWRHWTPTIWSLPALAAAINIGAYSFLFDTNKSIEPHIQILALTILTVLNLALALGIWKHRYMQKVFGDRLIEIEKYTKIIPIQFSTIQNRISSSWVYFAVACIIFLISLYLTVASIIRCIAT